MLLQEGGGLGSKRPCCVLTLSLGTSVPGQLRRETTAMGPQPFQLLPSFLGSLTSMLISGNFPGGFCDVGICPLRNGLEPQIHLK